MASLTKLRIDLKPSLQLAIMLGSTHSLAIGAAWVSMSSWPLFLSISGIFISVVACLAQALHRSPGAVTSLELSEGGRTAWRDRRGQWHDARLGVDHFVSTRLVAVSLGGPILRRKWIVILPDSVSTEQFRRLRIWLRWYGDSRPDKREKSAIRQH